MSAPHGQDERAAVHLAHDVAAGADQIGTIAEGLQSRAGEHAGELLGADLLAAGQVLTPRGRNARRNSRPQGIGEAGIVFTNKTPLTKETLAACPNLRYIGVLATGYNVVDIDEARRRGIAVCNVPDYSTKAVAQLVGITLLNTLSYYTFFSALTPYAVKSQGVDDNDANTTRWTCSAGGEIATRANSTAAAQ